MPWCCPSAENRFVSRLSYGEFLVAGMHPLSGKVAFLQGFNMCHRRDYSGLVTATRHAAKALEAEGVTNFKLSEHNVVHYCHQCGVHLSEHYGEDGGLLRDDEYVRELWPA